MQPQTPTAVPAASLLTPTDHTLILIDHEPQMGFATHSIGIAELRNNVAGLAKSAKLFNVPVVLTTVDEETFSGPIFPEIKEVFPDQKPIDRTSMNAWEDVNLVRAVEEIGRKRLVLAGLWTEVCVVMPALSALAQGYEVYVVTDACGGVSAEAHNMAVQRMVQAGVRPITWLQYLLELQRDWARMEAYNGVFEIASQHAGGYGLGMIYAGSMLKQAAAQPEKAAESALGQVAEQAHR
ncbi:hydrolase [Hymenobacter sp.]|uniref:hydrolase n=1 Tax=Hymenobacter sp. TaxID=1898978 RepID=UPI00286ABAAB|nr:hydrolase [Hymenobacter sp.]